RLILSFSGSRAPIRSQPAPNVGPKALSSCNQIAVFARHSISRVGLWYNHPTKRAQTTAEEEKHLETHPNHSIGNPTFDSLFSVFANAQPFHQAEIDARADANPTPDAGANSGRHAHCRSDQAFDTICLCAGWSDQRDRRGRRSGA